MTGIAQLHAQALEVTGRVVGRVTGDRWHAATPCGGWDARTPGQSSRLGQPVGG